MMKLGAQTCQIDNGFAPSSGRQALDDAAIGAVMLQNGDRLFQNRDIAAILS
jgi:hypothetical protein